MRPLSPVPELPGDRPDPLVPPREGTDRRRRVARDGRGVMGAPAGRSAAAAAAVTIATLALMLATGPRLAIVWDEGYTLGREERLRLWFRALADPVTFASTWEPPGVELVQQGGAQPPRREQVDTLGELLFDPMVL